MTRHVVAGVTDWFFVAKMEAAARQAGVGLTFVKSLEELVEMATLPADLVVLDLDDRTIDSMEAIQRLRLDPRTAGVPTLGFLSHVDVERARLAREAGCHTVLPRSRFSGRLVALLKGSEAR